jgi:DNA-binding IclR family transcriptional regulator
MTRRALNHTLFAMTARELMLGVSCQGLAQETGLNLATVRQLIKAMREHDVVRVLRWDPDRRGACRLPVYRLKLSPLEKDAPRPITEATRERHNRRMRQTV